MAIGGERTTGVQIETSMNCIGPFRIDEGRVWETQPGPGENQFRLSESTS